MSESRAVGRLLAEIVAASGDADRVAAVTPDRVRAKQIAAALAAVASVPDHQVEWVVLNGRRVDAGVVAPGREWRLVCSIDSEGVHSAEAQSRSLVSQVAAR